MIPRITRGRSASGALRYDYGPGKREEHRNPHQVAGNVAGRTWQARAYEIDAHARELRPDVEKPIYRTALRLAPEDRALNDREWRQVAERYAQGMGLDRGPWVATRHGPDHIHITACRVRWDGSLVPDRHDYTKAQRVVRGIETEHGLTDASTRYEKAPQVSHGERAQADRTGQPAARDRLRLAVLEAERASDGTRPSYEAELTRRGIEHRANVASTGRMNGYSYSVSRDAAGEPVWFKASQLGKSYSWGQQSQRLDARAAQVEHPTPATNAQPDPPQPSKVTNQEPSPGQTEGPPRRSLADQLKAARDQSTARGQDRGGGIER